MSPYPCASCGQTFDAGHICFAHSNGCPHQRRRDIHNTCDSLANDSVPADVIAPIRVYADTLGECDCV